MATNKNRSIFKKLFLNQNFFILKILIVFFLFIVSSFVIFIDTYKGDVKLKINDVLTRDIIAEDEIQYVDEDASSRNEEIIKMTTPTYFYFDNKITEKRISLLKTILINIASEITYEEIKKYAEENDFSLTINEYKLLNTILNQSSKDMDRIVAFVSDLYKRGVSKIDQIQLSGYEVSGIILASSVNFEMVESFYSINEFSLFTINVNDIRSIVNVSLSKYSDFDKKVFENFLINFFIPNIIIDKEKTETILKNKLKSERNVYRKMLKGQIVARKGDLIDKDNISKIVAVLNYKHNKINYQTIISFLLINFLLIVFTFFFIRVYDVTFFFDVRNLIFISAVYFLYIIYLSLPFNFDKTSYYLGIMVPISTISVTFIFLYSKITSISITIVFSIIFYLLSGYNSSSFLFILLSGLCSIFTIKPEIRRRVELLVAGFYIAIINCIIGFSIAYYDGLSFADVLNFTLYAGINGIVSGFFSVGLIAFGEFILNIPTVFRLQELTDTSSPLLKKLFDTAIGTYNHSINVANLAEVAANEIKANGLLAKVGGLYHDIGKAKNAEHFIENQGKNNVHDEMNPFVSVNIIRSHVKVGVEEAISAKLPKKVIDIVSQHHGKSVIKYFYNRALEERKEGNVVSIEDFQYKSENPAFPESAVVMLADQIEAISRVLSDYSVESFTSLVNAVVDEKFKDGILDDSGLTFNDITNIKRVFIRTLTGMYHSRIEYPEINKENNEVIKK